MPGRASARIGPRPIALAPRRAHARRRIVSPPSDPHAPHRKGGAPNRAPGAPLAADGPTQGKLSLEPREAERVLEGEVARVTYENDETGFRVLKIERREGSRIVTETVVGTFPAAPPGTHVRATGRYIDDPKHGPQFRAETLLTVAPSTLAGIERYLASGMVKGVGPASAKRIVAAFGERTLTVLDREPEQLRKVPGLGAARIKAISEAWAAHRDVNAIMVFLQAHGASPALATRIYRRFGRRAIHLVSESPYRLALDVWGVGFKTADGIARSLGVGEESPERTQAALLHTLLALATQGDVYATRAELCQRTVPLLAPDEPGPGPGLAELDEGIDALAEGRKVVLELLPNGETGVYTPDLHRAEVACARRLAALLRTPSRPLRTVEASIARFEKASGLELSASQRHAVEEAARSKVMVLTGGPGVGKTTIVRALIALFEAGKHEVALSAPTGRAAKRLSQSTGREAKTIHRLLEYDPRGRKFGRNADARLDVGVVVVDETSMVAIDLAEALLEALPDGARLVLVGDVDQLPSVGPGAVLRDVIASGVVPTVRLAEIFRQAHNSSIVINAHRIHDGLAPIGAVGKGEQFYLFERREPGEVADAIRELVTHRIPAGFGLDPVRDVQVLTPMQRGPIGVVALNEMLQATLNPSGPEVRRGNRILRLGDKVMQLRNDYEKEVFNGDVGQIIAVDAGARQLTVRFEDERDVRYEEGELDELVAAYATSIHKSQGSEYPAVVIPVSTQHFVMLSRNLLYTAVTRGRRLVVLVADPRALALALAAERKEERHTLLAHRLAEALR
ncbi:MAG: ATP-dependent RecD-like DNA helicase [Polyangiaceae bacterium]|nr:ATP-dependent RecD-like DNA helicase [Polyangiaceae bacterium]